MTPEYPVFAAHLRVGDRVLVEDYTDADGNPVMAAAVVGAVSRGTDQRVFVEFIFSRRSWYYNSVRADAEFQILPPERWAEADEAARFVATRQRACRRMAARKAAA